MVDARGGGLGHRRLGVVGDAEAGASSIAMSLAPSPTASVSSGASPSRRAARSARASPREPRIGSATWPASLLRRPTSRMLARFSSKPIIARDGGGEQREAAGDQAGVGAVRPHGRDQRPPPGRQRDALRDHLVDDRRRQALEQRHALAQRRLERDLAAHRPLGDRGDLRLQPDESASSSMHSWPIMVESMSATNSRLRRCATGWTTTSTAAPASAVAQPLGRARFVDRPRPGETECRRRRPFEPAARAGRQQPPRARAAGVVERRRGRDWRSGSRHESCDGEVGRKVSATSERCLSQVRPPAASRRWRSRSPSGSAASSSTPTPCRSIATCAFSRRGRRRKRRRACRIASTAMSMPPRTIRSAAGAPTRRRRSPTARARRAAADPRRRHRPLFQGADAGPVRCAADPGGDPRRGAGAAAREGVGARCMPSSRAAIRRRRRRSGRATGSASCARSRCWTRPAARSRLARDGAAAARPARALRLFLSPDRADLHRGSIALRGDAGAWRARRGEALAARALDPSCRP